MSQGCDEEDGVPTARGLLWVMASSGAKLQTRAICVLTGLQISTLLESHLRRKSSC